MFVLDKPDGECDECRYYIHAFLGKVCRFGHHSSRTCGKFRSRKILQDINKIMKEKS